MLPFKIVQIRWSKLTCLGFSTETPVIQVYILQSVNERTFDKRNAYLIVVSCGGFLSATIMLKKDFGLCYVVLLTIAFMVVALRSPSKIDIKQHSVYEIMLKL